MAKWHLIRTNAVLALTQPLHVLQAISGCHYDGPSNYEICCCNSDLCNSSPYSFPLQLSAYIIVTAATTVAVALLLV